jgi:hypothetical protein
MATKEIYNVIEFVIPFLNAVRELWPENDRKVLWPEIPHEWLLVGRELVEIRKNIAPIVEHYLSNYFSDTCPGEISRTIRKGFPSSVCRQIFIDSYFIYGLIAVACSELGPADDMANERLMEWLRENVGQMVLIIEHWGRKGVQINQERPKRLDGLSGNPYLDWGRPQFNALLIYWLSKAFEKNLKGGPSTGSKHIGICEKCRVVFKKLQTNSSKCRKCTKH